MNGATLSPDGHAVAFVSPVGGIAQVFLMLTSGGEPLQLTNDEGDQGCEQFFARWERNLLQDGLSAAMRFGQCRHSVGLHAVWSSANYVLPSPDGAFIFYMKSDSPEIFRAEKSGLSEELVYNSEGKGQFFTPLASAISRRQRFARCWCSSVVLAELPFLQN